jgi:nicotinamide-nucleotide amidase
MELKKLLDRWIYGFDDQDLPSVVGELLKKNQKTIALAESCTGGLLSKMITDIPGASEYFLGSWVTYSNGAKMKHLGVPEEIILENGAVSEPVARLMAESAAQTAGSDIGIGITGVAGPWGGTEEKPVGLVYIGVYIDDKCYIEKCRFPSNNRDWIRHRSALTALNMVRLRLKV